MPKRIDELTDEDRMSLRKAIEGGMSLAFRMADIDPNAVVFTFLITDATHIGEAKTVRMSNTTSWMADTLILTIADQIIRKSKGN